MKSTRIGASAFTHFKMFNADDLAAELPAPRDDEPSTLRQDILDELADHLHCAVQHEFLASGKATTRDQAEQSAVERFGNPAAVAARLWWDAMKEKIMAQRITAIMVSVAAAACVLSCILVWRALADSRDAQMAMLESQRDAFGTMISQFTESLEASRDPYATWQPLQIKLVDLQGDPVAGTVYASGKPIGSDQPVQETVETGTNGIADFELLPAGEYSVNVCVKEPSTCTPFSFLLGPRRASSFTIVCPTTSPGPLPVNIEIQPPSDLATVPLYYVAQIQYGQWQFAGRGWSPTTTKEIYWLLDSQGRALGELSHDKALEREERGISTSYFFASKLEFPEPLKTADQLMAYDSSLRLVAYVASTEAGGSSPPPLRSLNTAMHTTRIEAGDKGVLTASVRETDTEFWSEVREKLNKDSTSKEDVEVASP